MRSAFGFDGQKCSANSRVYVERPVHDELVRLLVEKTEKLTIGDPLVRANWMGPVIDQRRSTATSRGRRGATRRHGLHRRRAPDRRRPGPRLLCRADGRRGPAELAPAVPRRAVRALHGGRCGRFAGRGDRLANDSVLGLTAGVYSEDPRRSSNSWTMSRRACSTSTGEPGRRPARGRASRRSAAGRGVARPARRGCRCTTSHNLREQCLPSSTSAARDGAGGRCDLRSALTHLGVRSLSVLGPPSPASSGAPFSVHRPLARRGTARARVADLRSSLAHLEVRSLSVLGLAFAGTVRRRDSRFIVD